MQWGVFVDLLADLRQFLGTSVSQSSLGGASVMTQVGDQGGGGGPLSRGDIFYSIFLLKVLYPRSQGRGGALKQIGRKLDSFDFHTREHGKLAAWWWYKIKVPPPFAFFTFVFQLSSPSLTIAPFSFPNPSIIPTFSSSFTSWFSRTNCLF